MTFFISDTHFGDSEDGFVILGRENIFENKDDMINQLIENWNATVRKSDTVYHLGDVFWGLSDEVRKDIIRQLNGTKILIMGNHDRDHDLDYWRKIGFNKVYDMPVLYNNGFLLSHEPIYITYGPIINIFGHVHSSTIYKDYSPTHFCACVERINYTPVTEEYIRFCVNKSRREAFLRDAYK